MSAAERFKALISGSIHPLLRKSGYRKRGLTWNADLGPLITVVQVQRSAWSTELCCDFTINLGLVVKEVHEVVTGAAPARFVSFSHCFPGFPIGRFNLLRRDTSLA